MLEIAIGIGITVNLLLTELFGFASAEDYWRRCSSGPLLAGVRRPLLALSASDDPIVPADTLPVAAARANPQVTLETTAGLDLRAIGFIVPGLIANQALTQGVWPTLVLTALAAAIVRVALVLLVGWLP